jgi:chaperonin cofactor prefoldin
MRAVYSSRSSVLSECVAVIVDELEREIEELRNQMTACETQQERITALEERIEEQQERADAPFPVKWYRW